MKIKIKGGTYLKTTSLYDRTESSENEVSSDNNVYSSEESSYQNSTEQIRMKSGDSSEISANGAVYNYNSEERLVEFSLASLKNNTEDCTGSLKLFVGLVNTDITQIMEVFRMKITDYFPNTLLVG